MKVLTVIIPVYNEEATIDTLLTKVIDERVPDWKKQIIVVDDCSSDSTKKILKGWEKKVTVIYKDKNEGKGSAVTLALAKARGDIILIQDADLEYDPKDYPVLLEPFGDESIHAVYGSRFLGPHLTTMFVYAMGNKFVTLMTNILYNTNITDMETGFKAFRRTIVENMDIRAKRFDFEPELTAKILKKGYQIFEVPISYRGRKFEEGKKLTWKDGVYALITLLKFRFMD